MKPPWWLGNTARLAQSLGQRHRGAPGQHDLGLDPGRHHDPSRGRRERREVGRKAVIAFETPRAAGPLGPSSSAGSPNCAGSGAGCAA